MCSILVLSLSVAIAALAIALVHQVRLRVEGETAARREVIGLQRDLRSDQAELYEQRDALESARRQFDTRRQQLIATERRDSVWSALVSSGGLIAASLAPLILAAAALWGLWRDVGDQEAAELVLTEIMQETARVTGPIAENSDGDPASLAGPRDTPGLPPSM
jgi:hypothetical protein